MLDGKQVPDDSLSSSVVGDSRGHPITGSLKQPRQVPDPAHAANRTMSEQIREAIEWSRGVDPDATAEVATRFGHLLTEAADTIESLQAEVEMLTETLDQIEGLILRQRRVNE